VITADNDPVVIRKALDFFENNVKPGFIQLGETTQNAYIESFNSNFRGEGLNRYVFVNLMECETIETGNRITIQTCRAVLCKRYPGRIFSRVQQETTSRNH